MAKFNKISYFMILVLALVSVGKAINKKEEPTCPPDGTVTFPDPESCSSYYLCTGGNLYHFSCPEGTYWNQDAGLCDLPENVECSLDPTTVIVQPSTTENPPVPEPDCPTEDGVFLVPYPQNCSLYFICFENGESFLVESCADGTLFDPSDRLCKPADEVDCGNSSTNPPTQMTTSQTSPPGDYSCPADIEFIYMPHPVFCSMFYWCEFGEYKGESKCGVNLWFDFDSQACVDPYHSSCDKEIRPTTVQP